MLLVVTGTASAFLAICIVVIIILGVHEIKTGVQKHPEYTKGQWTEFVIKKHLRGIGIALILFFIFTGLLSLSFEISLILVIISNCFISSLFSNKPG